MEEKNKKIITISVLFLIVFIAWSFRAYKFSEYLHFGWDQARDLEAIEEANEKGPAYLPMIGPHAVKLGKDQILRLGPAYHYLQYLTSRLTGSEAPDKIAFLELYSSLFLLIILFIFLRLYFSRILALLLALLFSLSWVVIQFSRFAWNPNITPVFLLLCFYSLLSFYRTDKFKKRLFFVAVWTASFSIVTQLHYMPMFSILAISSVYVVYKMEFWKRQEFFQKIRSMKDWVKIKNFLLYLLVALPIALVIFSPMIISDYRGDTVNYKTIIPSIFNKSEEGGKGENIAILAGHNVIRQTRSQWLLLTSLGYPKSLDEPDIYALTGGVFVLISLISILYLIFKEKKQDRKDFLIFSLIWFWVFFLATTPMVEKMHLRYFLSTFPLVYIFLGSIMMVFIKIFNKKTAWVGIAVISFLLLFLNIKSTIAWFGQLEKDQQNIDYTPNQSFIENRNKDYISYGQLKRAAEYVLNKRGNEPIFYFSSEDYKSPLEYLWQINGIERASIQKVDKKVENIPVRYYFAVVESKRIEKDIPAAFSKEGKLIGSERFGQLVVNEYELNLPAKGFESNKDPDKHSLRWIDLFDPISQKSIDNNL